MKKFLATVAVAAPISASLVALTATTASADALPADCTTNHPNYYTMQVTCTNRPAGQNWHISGYCLSMHGIEDIYQGNTVTGNGTSTGQCLQGGYTGTPSFWVE